MTPSAFSWTFKEAEFLHLLLLQRSCRCPGTENQATDKLKTQRWDMNESITYLLFIHRSGLGTGSFWVLWRLPAVFREILNSRIYFICHLITQTLALCNQYFLFTGHCPHFIYWFRHLVTTELHKYSILGLFFLSYYMFTCNTSDLGFGWCVG